MYLDCNATTPVDPRVSAAVEAWHAEHFGNPASKDHRWGWEAAEAVEEARLHVAAALAVRPRDVIFVSGATEALTTVVRGYVGYGDWSRKKIVTCATEHDAVIAPVRHLCRLTGVASEVLPVDADGHVSLSRLREVLEGSSGALVALMAANNEIGTFHPIREIADIVHSCGGTFLCDTTQAFGRSEMDLSASDVDFATVSSHKVHGPKGAGALIARGRDAAIEPLLLGGGQERGVRGGTLNVPGIVGLGEACRLVHERVEDDMRHMGCLRDRLESGVLSQIDDAWVNGDRSLRLCNTTNLGFKGVDARTLIRDMHDIAVSTRSACASGYTGPSHVLQAIGLSDDDAYSCVRCSLGRFTTEEEIDYAIAKLAASVHKLRRSKALRS